MLPTAPCLYYFQSALLLQVSSIRFQFRLPSFPSTKHVRMASSGDGRTVIPNLTPKVSKLQESLNRQSADGWDKCWEQGVTPWDLGQPTPVILHLLQAGKLPKGRVLVPGCGSGYDVVAVASPARFVVGLDISDIAIKKAQEIASLSPNVDYISFLKADFFTWRPTELFDLIFDYTFFCAIEPGIRSTWARQVRDCLKPDGELITLMFPIGDHIGGPPYKVSVTNYEEVLHPMGFKAISVMDNDFAIKPRKIIFLTLSEENLREHIQFLAGTLNS